MNKQINIDQEKIESTQIIINVKTLLWIGGILLFGLTTLFGVLTSKIDNVQESVDNLDVVKITPLDEGYHDLDKKVYYLLMRTNSRHEGHTDGTVPGATRPSN